MPATFRMNSAPDNGGSDFHFVACTGRPDKNPMARRLIKQTVMQHIHRLRKKPLITKRNLPLRCNLDVPHTFNKAVVEASKTLKLGTGQSDFISDSLPLDLELMNWPEIELQEQDMSTRMLTPPVDATEKLGTSYCDPLTGVPIKLGSRARELLDLSEFFTPEFL